MSDPEDDVFFEILIETDLRDPQTDQRSFRESVIEKSPEFPEEEPPEIPLHEPEVIDLSDIPKTKKLIITNPTTHDYTSEELRIIGAIRSKAIFEKYGKETLFYHADVSGKKTKFKPQVLATYLELQNPIVTIKPDKDNLRDLGDFWYYDFERELYVPTGKSYIAQRIKNIFKDDFQPSMVQKVLANIAYSTYVSREKFYLPKNILPLKNGLLTMDLVNRDPFDLNSEKCLSLGLIPNNPKLFVTTRLSVEYDPEATCPKIKKFLQEILPLSHAAILQLQEYVGYCLYRAWPFDKVIMLLGEGANGKSTLISLIRRLLGAHNVVGIEIADLCHHRWYLAELYKKLANLAADIAPRDLKQTSRFKTATGGDLIQGERKYKDPFWFSSFCKHILSANTMPYVYDDSDAFYRRWLIIRFTEQFLGDKDDPNILDKMIPELPGFLNWALKGLERLLLNERFTEEPEIEEIRTQWNMLSDPIYALIHSELVRDPEGHIPKERFKDLLSQFCNNNNLTLPSEKKIGATLGSKRFPYVDHSYPAIGEVYTGEKGIEKRKQVACWKGIREQDWEDVRKKEAIKKKKEREKATEIDELFGERLMERRREEGE